MKSGLDCLISGLDCLISGLDCLMSGLDCLISGPDCLISGLDCLLCDSLWAGAYHAAFLGVVAIASAPGLVNPSSSSVLLYSLELSDTQVYEP